MGSPGVRCGVDLSRSRWGPPDTWSLSVVRLRHKGEQGGLRWRGEGRGGVLSHIRTKGMAWEGTPGSRSFGGRRVVSWKRPQSQEEPRVKVGSLRKRKTDSGLGSDISTDCDPLPPCPPRVFRGNLLRPERGSGPTDSGLLTVNFRVRREVDVG